MDYIYIEPDPGQQATVEIEDFNDKVFSAFEYEQPVFIGEVRVMVKQYTRLKPLGFSPGYRARVVVERVR